MTEQLVQSGRLQEKFCAQMPLIGDKAPAFEAETTKGMIRFPDDYAGKWVIFFSFRLILRRSVRPNCLRLPR